MQTALDCRGPTTCVRAYPGALQTEEQCSRVPGNAHSKSQKGMTAVEAMQYYAIYLCYLYHSTDRISSLLVTMLLAIKRCGQLAQASSCRQ